MSRRVDGEREREGEGEGQDIGTAQTTTCTLFRSRRAAFDSHFSPGFDAPGCIQVKFGSSSSSSRRWYAYSTAVTSKRRSPQFPHSAGTAADIREHPLFARQVHAIRVLRLSSLLHSGRRPEVAFRAGRKTRPQPRARTWKAISTVISPSGLTCCSSVLATLPLPLLTHLGGTPGKGVLECPAGKGSEQFRVKVTSQQNIQVDATLGALTSYGIQAP